MSQELKPCPFCGSARVKAFAYGQWVGGEPDAFAQCQDCGATGPSGKTEPEAVSVWNRRAAAAPPVAPARVPLTDEQINQITAEQWGAGLGAPYAAYRAYARAIEAAHGITPTKEA